MRGAIRQEYRYALREVRQHTGKASTGFNNPLTSGSNSISL